MGRINVLRWKAGRVVAVAALVSMAALPLAGFGLPLSSVSADDSPAASVTIAEVGAPTCAAYVIEDSGLVCEGMVQNPPAPPIMLVLDQ